MDDPQPSNQSSPSPDSSALSNPVTPPPFASESNRSDVDRVYQAIINSQQCSRSSTSFLTPSSSNLRTSVVHTSSSSEAISNISNTGNISNIGNISNTSNISNSTSSSNATDSISVQASSRCRQHNESGFASTGSVSEDKLEIKLDHEEDVFIASQKRKSDTERELPSPGKRYRGEECTIDTAPSTSSMILSSQSYMNEPTTQQYGHIPMSPRRQSCTRRNSSKTAAPPRLNNWLQEFMSWPSSDRTQALNALVACCDAPHVRHLMAVIEPQFQRDFISLLPKELALYVLSFLSAPDLVRASQTCQYWRQLANDRLLWRAKCKEVGADPMFLQSEDENSDDVINESDVNWKSLYIKNDLIEQHWLNGESLPQQILRGHDDHVITCLEFYNDYIVSGSDDNTLKVWDVSTGQCMQTLVGHTGGVWSSQMRDNIVISGSTDRTLRVWDVNDGTCLFTLVGHSSTVRCMSLYKNQVVSGSRDATLRVWNVLNGVCEHILLGHVAAVRCVQFDGKKIVSGAYDFTVRIWDPSTEVCLHVLTGHTNRVYSLQFDGKHIVSGSLDTSIRVWDVDTGEALHTLIGHQSLTSGMELQDGILVSGNADSTVKVWDIKTGQCLQTLSGHFKHNSAVTCLQFNRKFVITSSDDGTVKLWCLKSGKFIRNLVTLESGGSGGVVWRVRATNTKLVCAAGSRNGTEETKLIVLNFGLKDDQLALITDSSRYELDTVLIYGNECELH